MDIKRGIAAIDSYDRTSEDTQGGICGKDAGSIYIYIVSVDIQEAVVGRAPLCEI